MSTIKVIIYFCLLLLLPVSLQAITIDITGRKAKGNGKTDNTEIIQAAIDECSKAKGGTVIIPSGRFMTRTLYLKSDVDLHLEKGAILLGNTDIQTYLDKKEKTPAILFAEGAENISVTGLGMIDGQGQHPTFQQGEEMKGGLRRPKCIYFINCRNVTVEGITIQNPAEWAQFYKGCDGVVIRGVKVYAHANLNNDGLDIDSRNVIVSDCYIDADDDALCFKSDRDQACENIVVTNCLLRSNCNAIKFGTSCMSGFKNITVSNCNIQRAKEDNFRQWYRALPWLGATGTAVLSGIALEAVDGGVMNQISISNIVMKDVQTPIFIRLGDRKRNTPDKISTLKNIKISDIIATQTSRVACSITGVPGGVIDNISIRNVHITAVGGGTAVQANEAVPEMVDSYPENRMFGVVLPASGFYVRHAKNIQFENVSLDLLYPDARPMFKLKQTEHIQIENCRLGDKEQTDDNGDENWGISGSGGLRPYR